MRVLRGQSGDNFWIIKFRGILGDNEKKSPNLEKQLAILGKLRAITAVCKLYDITSVDIHSVTGDTF